MTKGVKPVDDKIELIRQLTEEGVTRSEIARQIGYSSRTVARYQNKMGYFPNTRKPYERNKRKEGLEKTQIRFYGHGSKIEYNLDVKTMTIEMRSTGGKAIRFSVDLLEHLMAELCELSEQLSNYL